MPTRCAGRVAGSTPPPPKGGERPAAAGSCRPTTERAAGRSGGEGSLLPLVAKLADYGASYIRTTAAGCGKANPTRMVALIPMRSDSK